MQSSGVDRVVWHWATKQRLQGRAPKYLGLLIVVAIGLGLAGCHKKPQEKQADATGQEVAQVGTEPITTSELQLEAKSSNLRQAPTEQDKARALLRVAARKNLTQRAIAQGLDRQPVILLEIRRAREQILAEAVAIEAAKTDEKKLSLEKINAFIAAHPFQFGKRAILQVHELLIPASKDVEKIVGDVKAATKLDEISAYFDKNKIEYQPKNAELDTATIPDPLNNALQMGNTIPIIRTPSAAIFMQVTQSRPEPITGTTAEKLARNAMTKTFYETELAAPGPDAAVTYNEPYKAIIAKQKASPLSQGTQGALQSTPATQDAQPQTPTQPPSSQPLPGQSEPSSPAAASSEGSTPK